MLIESLFAFALSISSYQWTCLERVHCPIPTVEIQALDGDRAGSFSYLTPLKLTLDTTVDLNTPEGQATVVHEFTHYLQWRAGKYTPATTCAEKVNLEAEAYKAGSAYLKTKGIDKDFAGELFTAAMSCPADE